MSTLNIRISKNMDDAKDRFEHSLVFESYAAMHEIMTPARLAIVMALAGLGFLSIPEIARRVGRDELDVQLDLASLINRGMIDQADDRVVFPYDKIHFEYDVNSSSTVGGLEPLDPEAQSPDTNAGLDRLMEIKTPWQENDRSAKESRSAHDRRR